MRVRDSGMPYEGHGPPSRYQAGCSDLSIRPRPKDILAWAGVAGLRCPGDEVRDLPPWHFGLVLDPEAGR